MEQLSKRLGLKLEKVTNFEEAITHSSLEEETNNKKLAFLGDAVLGLVVSIYIHQNYPELSVGKMTDKRAFIVNSHFLSEKAKEWGLNNYLRLGKGEKQSGGDEKETILAEAVEAVIGAIFLDYGFDETARFIERNLIPKKIELADWNFKGRLQEFALSKGMGIPEYSVIEESGNGNKKFFGVDVKIGGRIIGEGEGRNKKEAETVAARRALRTLTREEDNENNSLHKTGS